MVNFTIFLIYFEKITFFFLNIFRKIIKIGRYISYPIFLFFWLIRDLWSPYKNIFWVKIILYPYEKYTQRGSKIQQNPIFVYSGRPGLGNWSTILGNLIIAFTSNLSCFVGNKSVLYSLLINILHVY